MPKFKPYSESCEQNKEPILAVLKEVFADRKNVLELGSGTGQHAVYFGQQLSHLQWQTSDLAENHKGILAWLEDAKLPNVFPPLKIDANDSVWPTEQANSNKEKTVFDAIFSANAVHIMGWSEVENLFKGIGRVLAPNGILCLYGPFNYGGKFTSDSNARFDQWLKSNNPKSGVRDFEAIDALAKKEGLFLLKDFEMPANNRTLVWVRR